MGARSRAHAAVNDVTPVADAAEGDLASGVEFFFLCFLPSPAFHRQKAIPKFRTHEPIMNRDVPAAAKIGSDSNANGVIEAMDALLLAAAALTTALAQRMSPSTTRPCRSDAAEEPPPERALVRATTEPPVIIEDTATAR